MERHPAGGVYEYLPPFMPRYDQRCQVCDWTGEVVVRPYEQPPCPACAGATERYYPLGGRRQVISDEIIGGRWYENLGHEPVWIESKSHLKREMARRGLTEKVRHVGVKGSDKSPYTSRWV